MNRRQFLYSTLSLCTLAAGASTGCGVFWKRKERKALKALIKAIRWEDQQTLNFRTCAVDGGVGVFFVEADAVFWVDDVQVYTVNKKAAQVLRSDYEQKEAPEGITREMIIENAS